MERIITLLNRFGQTGTLVGAFFLLWIVLLTVANVVVRFFGPTIIGAYTLVEMSIVVAVSLALPFTALHKAHTKVNVIVMNLPQRWQALCEAITSFIGLVTWGVIAWASLVLMLERGLAEKTEVLELPYLPSRMAWTVSLTFVCLILFMDMLIALKGIFRK